MRNTLAAVAVVWSLVGCTPTPAAPPTTLPAPVAAEAAPLVDPPAPVDPAAQAKTAQQATAEGEDDKAYQACLKAAPRTPPANEKPPVNAKGLFADKSSCWGCSDGWWRTEEPITLRAAPDEKAAPTTVVAPQTWLYLRETVSYVKPIRGVVTAPGREFQLCDVVYFIGYNVESDEGGIKVWRQGQQLATGFEDDTETIRWEAEMPNLTREGSGWWVRFDGQKGEAGWGWASAGAYEYSCKWNSDPQQICDSAPKDPPPEKR